MSSINSFLNSVDSSHVTLVKAGSIITGSTAALAATATIVKAIANPHFAVITLLAKLAFFTAVCVLSREFFVIATNGDEMIQARENLKNSTNVWTAALALPNCIQAYVKSSSPENLLNVLSKDTWILKHFQREAIDLSQWINNYWN